MLLKAMALSQFYLCLFGLLMIIFSSSKLVSGEQGDGEQADAASTRPSFLSNSGEHTVSAGQTATLPCMVKDAGEDFTVSWFKVAPPSDPVNNEPYNGDQPGVQLFVGRLAVGLDERFELTDETDDETDYGLKINDATGFDSGPYECHISTTPPMIQRQILKVNVPPSVSIDPDSNPYVVEPGHSITLKCYAGGYPPPDVVWSKVPGPLPDGRASHMQKEQAQLFYDTASVNHSGVYRCTADNNVGDPASAQITIEVYSQDRPEHAPSVQTERKFIPVKVGDTFAISCNYSAYPPPQVHWIHNSFGVNSHKWRDRAAISFSKTFPDRELQTTTLTITEVQRSEFGAYICRVANSLGTSEEVIHVSGKPGPPYLFTAASYEDRIDLSWHLESAADITGYKLFYRKPDEDVSLSIAVPASNGKRAKENEWIGNVSLRLGADGALLEPNSDYLLLVQGINEYGDGSLPKSPLEIRTPAKFHLDDEEMHKTGRDPKAADLSGGQASKSTKNDGLNGGAASYPSRTARIVSAIIIPMILTLCVWNLGH